MESVRHALPVNYLWTLLLHNLLLAALCWILGVWVLRCGVKVNYTRKINHFALMIVPLAAAPLLPYEPNLWTITATLVVFVIMTGIFVGPIRERISMVKTAFASVDRPEDQPHTLLWIITQAVAAYAVLMGLFLLLRWLGHPELVAVPLIVTGIGDGLAEPVGVRFGRHQYRVPSLARGRVYVRSLEGSACVFLIGLLTVLAFSGGISRPQWIALLVVLPLLMTFVEAISPHSWDAPFLYAAGGGCIAAVLTLLPGTPA